VGTFFPLCGKTAKHFSIAWKNRANFSTVWKTFFHTMENPAAAPARWGDILGFVKTV
jgi:hypothetical protein